MSASEHGALHQKLLRSRVEYYDRVLQRLVALNLDQCTLDFQYIRFDPNNIRKEKELAKVLVAHLVPFSLREERLIEAESNIVNFAMLEAKSLFTKRKQSGESGELLLYFLIEIVLGAPQVLAKMSLKTSSAMEVHGSDGVHAKLKAPGEPLDVYLGESKLHQDASTAITEALASIDKVRREGVDREVMLATENFKWIDSEAKEKILQLLDPNSPSHSCRIHFVVLVGFSLPPHGNRKTKETERDFIARYRKKTGSLRELLRTKTEGRNEPWDDIVHVFFVPFTDVERFREDFVKWLT